MTKKFNMDKVPVDLDSAVTLLYDALGEVDFRFISQNKDYQAVLGTNGDWLKKNWSMHDPETPLVSWFMDNLGIQYADDICGTILAALWAKARNEKFYPEQHVQRYYNHWWKLNIDPKTLQVLNKRD